MRTVVIVIVGLVVATILLFSLRNLRSAPNPGLLLFLVIWAAVCAWNLSVGLSHGYSVNEELPFLAANFLLPAVFAWSMRNRIGRRAI